MNIHYFCISIFTLYVCEEKYIVHIYTDEFSYGQINTSDCYRPFINVDFMMDLYM